MKQLNLFINMAMTIDGKVMRSDKKWYGLSSTHDKIEMDKIRSRADILITGKNSILRDNPVVKIRYVKTKKQPRICILLNRGSLPLNRNIFGTEEKPLIFCNEKNFTEVKKNLDKVAEIHCLENYTQPKDVLHKLKKLGYFNILLEGGPKLNYSFLKENLVNRVYLTIVPFIIGQGSLLSIADGEKELSHFDTQNWNLQSCEKIESEVFLIYDKK